MNSSVLAVEILAPLITTFESIQVVARDPLEVLQLPCNDARGHADPSRKTYDVAHIRTKLHELCLKLGGNKDVGGELARLFLLFRRVGFDSLKEKASAVQQEVTGLMEKRKPEVVVR